MIDTQDLSSYYPGYGEYCEPREIKEPDDSNIDDIIDEIRLRELEEKESD